MFALFVLLLVFLDLEILAAKHSFDILCLRGIWLSAPSHQPAFPCQDTNPYFGEIEQEVAVEECPSLFELVWQLTLYYHPSL